MKTPNALNVASKIVQQPVSALLPYARNSRTHSDEQVAQIAASIREFGFTNPVLVDGANGIVAGHGRVMAAQLLGMPEVPTVNVGWMTGEQRRAYVIADNQLALNAGWDEAVLAQELGELDAAGFSVDLLGFSDDFLAGLIAGAAEQDGAGSGARPEDGGINYQEKYAVLVECKNESEQQRVFERLQGEGLICKVLVN